MKVIYMNTDNGVTYKFHHIGIPTTKKHEGEIYIPAFKMYVYTSPESLFRTQYHRFENDSPLHPLITSMTHVAFQVNDMEKAMEGYPVLLEPYFPFDRFQVAAIEVNGMPIELIKTDLSDEAVWGVKVSDEYCANVE